MQSQASDLYGLLERSYLSDLDIWRFLRGYVLTSPSCIGRSE